MARKSNFIGTTETGNLSALGSAQQRDYEFIKGLLNRGDLIKYFAEPSVQENQEKIDWYSEAPGKIISFQDFSTVQVERTRKELNALISDLASLASHAESQVDRQAIENLSVLPDTDSIKLVGEQVTIINWAYRLHKRAKGDRQSVNFAGLADIEPEVEATAEITDDSRPEELDNLSEELSLSNDDLFDEAVNPNSALRDDDGSERPEVEDYEDQPVENQSSEDEGALDRPPDTDRPPLIDKTGWIALLAFFVLLVFAILLLKDACGVRGLPFLYFC